MKWLRKWWSAVKKARNGRPKMREEIQKSYTHRGERPKGDPPKPRRFTEATVRKGGCNEPPPPPPQGGSAIKKPVTKIVIELRQKPDGEGKL